ncbi:hypothetical protein DPMN_112653 [Dreissena polymorpha]|uniref:Uncharacterized protein n=1 Tax=Dreissena polymorpha TaxID=45954 RepID=A0A9D4KG40_DREPO|nr:hypothetical protein DPMN_112653 [Dreissena polymorpha]
MHCRRTKSKAEVDTKRRLANPARVTYAAQLFRDSDCKVCSRQVIRYKMVHYPAPEWISWG